MPARIVVLLAGFWGRAGYWVREYFGENHYPRYLAAWQLDHVGKPAGGSHRPMTEREFFAQQVQIRFGGSVQRC